MAVASRFEQVFRDSFAADRRRTLAVVCFPLGTWVGGLYTAACCRHLAVKGYPITMVATGNDLDEILRVVPELAAEFDQTVLLGYPPFLKSVIDTGRAHGLDLSQHEIKLVLAGEVFSEEWRDLVAERAGMRHHAYDSAALYGTADAGVLGNETPLSITIRRFLATDPAAAHDLFGESRLPTLVQYDPGHRYFEEHDGTLVVSGDSGVPLVRYHIADEGGVIGYEEMSAFCATHGFDPLAAGLDRGIHPMPFVYVFGRSQFTVSYFGANIYPETSPSASNSRRSATGVTGKLFSKCSRTPIATVPRGRRGAGAGEVTVPSGRDRERRDPHPATPVEQRVRPLRAGSPASSACSAAPDGRSRLLPRGVKHRYTRG